MGKSELFSHFAERFEVKRTQSREFFDELAALCEKELKRSGEFVLPGMVKLVVQKRKARMGRNPATDQESRQNRRQGANRQAAQGRSSAPQVTAFSTPLVGTRRRVRPFSRRRISFLSAFSPARGSPADRS
jgi:nucleoid DNA-binding protein